MYHADGVLCPVTFAMHLAAAVETKPGRPRHRACVVVAGGREPAHWEAYTHHQFLSVNGILPCCSHGGCWKSRCQLVGDGDAKDRSDLCESHVQVTPELRIPRCMELITAADVIRKIELYACAAAENSDASPRSLAIGYTSQTLPSLQRKCCPPAKLSPALEFLERKDVLIQFRHGLGDAVQLTAVLRHLRHYYPRWAIDVASLRGKHSAFAGLCRNALVLNEESFQESVYDQVFSLDWNECRHSYRGIPSTKTALCLNEVFGLSPIPELCQYEIKVSDSSREAAWKTLAEYCPSGPSPTGKYPVVLIHYQGNTSSDRKDLPHDLVRELCDLTNDLGFVPVILDWDRRSPLIDQQTIFNPGSDHELWSGSRTGDAGILAALIESSSLMVGIDSGPLHIAGATSTPTIGVWTQHHPIHFFDLAPNVTHLIPSDHHKLAADEAAVQYFKSNYRHHIYRQLYVDLLAMVESSLTGEDFERLANKRFLKRLSATSFDAQYYEEHKLAGLDYLNFGEWQQLYGRWLVEALKWQGCRVLEVGCACGSVLRGLGEAGAIMQGVEINEHMVSLRRSKWPDMARLLHVCDAVNLHLFNDGAWQGIHSAQVAEHWKPKLVPHILEELHRVTVAGGLFFCALDTEELFARQGRTIEAEDPTHVCIKPLGWWHDQLSAAGWQVCSSEFDADLRNHPGSFLRQYDWDWFVARRMG